MKSGRTILEFCLRPFRRPVRQKVVFPETRLCAPIVPHKEAAGVLIGSSIAPLIAAHPPVSLRHLDICDVMEWDSLEIRSDASREKAAEIMVYGRYQGRTEGGLGLGMTLRDVAGRFGTPFEDDEDCLRIADLPAIALETTPWNWEKVHDDYDPDAMITHIFVTSS